jgi:hypothetical protein
MNDNKEIYLRILADVQFMSEVIEIIIGEAGSFGGQMLQERIAIERETLRLEQERVDRETAERQREQEELRERKSDD